MLALMIKAGKRGGFACMQNNSFRWINTLAGAGLGHGQLSL